MNSKKILLHRIVSIIFVAILMVASFAVGNATGLMTRTVSASEEPAEFAVFWEAWDLVVEHFVDRDKIDFTAMTYGAIKGMLQTLGDEGHTAFLSPEDLQQHESSLEGRYEGIGAYVSMDEGQVKIVAPIDGSPAEASGILPGDQIIAIDGKPIDGLSLSDVISLIRGPAGSDVVLTVLHPDETEPVEILVTRGQIELDSVSWSMIPGTDFAYVKITQFAADTGNELEAALQEIDDAKKQGQSVRGLVLDLRNNPGGFLREAIRVSSQFLNPGTVVLQEQDADGNVQEYKSRGWGQARKIPMIVLINQGTASAGEITAGALQENGRAQLIGQTTFGTGTVLNQFNLSDGSAILLGVTNWLTPSGKLIKGQGIEPDVPVEQPASVELVDARSLREMSADELAEVEDLQFLTGLDILRQETPGMQQANTSRPSKPILEYLPSIPWQLPFQVH